MDWLRALLETSPLTALFLVIAVGYLVGEINVKGFALGSGAVLFVGLACGAFAPKAAPPGMLGTLGLLLFLYCVGIQYGGEWYRGLTSASGLRANVVALCGLAAAAAAALVIQQHGRGEPARIARDVRRRGNDTPALQAVLDALGNQDAAVGYSVAYPFGVAGPILCMYALPRDLQAEDRRRRGSADEAGRGPRAERGARRTAIRSIFSRACRKACRRSPSAAAGRTGSRMRPRSSGRTM